MAAPESNVTVDLRTQVPVGWTLTGLSEPRFDGVNYYRAVQDNVSTVKFITDRAWFAEVEYQVYSKQTVNVKASLDGVPIGQRIFPAGRFVQNEFAGAFVESGNHVLTLHYSCLEGPCRSPISQYWTRIRLNEAGQLSSRRQAGLNVERWLLDAPDSLIQADGVGPLRFDGTNYLRPITDEKVQLFWPKVDAINTTAYIYARQPIEVVTRVNGRIVGVERGDQTKGVSIAVPLKRQESTGVSYTVRCLGNTGSTGCAYLYFPQVSVATIPPAGLGVHLGAVALTGLLLLGGWHLLRPAGSGEPR
ncbi:hypothetical protein [Deinococcus soli (ex Cha et al. 2016)]|jgi:hypothetical protein|uniref:hypothetical protein n=1 Tax=Deinococcus soli (ex Cha et al. 2016) TaxID=1309411 RepID=UPI0016663634|nr:hypothetical protein [Deinococcus soli (ex Cha et al. 2016)]